MGSPLSPCTSQNTKSQNRLNLEKHGLSYAHLHSEVTKNVDNIPSMCSELHQKQQVGSKAIKNEELVKHMSKLPTYLERGENLKDKALNVGVLDWRNLEKWQHNHKQIPNRSSRYSPSSSDTSSFFSTDESSNCSSRGHSCSPARQKIHRPTLLSHLNASPKEVYSQCVKSSVGNVGKLQDLKGVPINPLNGQQSILRTYQSFNKNALEIKLKECKRKDSAPQIIPETKISRDFKSSGLPLSSKGKMKIQDGEYMKEPENSHSELSHPFDSTEMDGQKSGESSRRSFSEGSHSELYLTELYSDIPHSCPLPCEVGGIKHSQIEQPISIDAKSDKFSSDPSQPSPSSAKLSISPSRSRILEEKRSTLVPMNSTAMESSKGLELKIGTSEAIKVRNPSPTRRFIHGLGGIGRNSISRDIESRQLLNFKHVPAKYGADRAEASASLDYSTTDKPSTTSMARTSPLRRLLDPLMKPKAANSHHFVEPSHKGSTSTNKACKSSDGRGESSIVHSVKVKLDLKSCRKTDIDDAKHGSSTRQALLQIAMKNGLPLFTFAVENSSDVLAATVRLSSSRKDDTWTCTFFTVREMKKKNGSWFNQGDKGKGHGYIPNVVAQMKVSDPSFSNLSRPHSMDHFSIREFVLFAVDSRQLDQQTSDLRKNDELAAIVVKFPRKTLNLERQQNYYFNDLSARGYSKNEESGLFVGTQDLFNTTVILPGGVHGKSSKGEASPLIERWVSGGLCDCGGWDLGCRVRVLANQTPPSTRSSSAKAHQATGRFELFSQGEVVNNRTVFSMSSFKNGIFSVEFNSSLSLLQAFSICIAVLDSRKPSGLSKLSNLMEEKLSEETTSPENDTVKVPNQVQVEVPA